jgi:hypothetical protein
MKNPTPYEIALLAAAIAHGRDPLQHINDAWALLRACAAPAIAPVEAPPVRLTYKQAVAKICPGRNASRQEKSLFEFFTHERLEWDRKHGNCQPGGYAWDSPPREATKDEQAAARVIGTGCIARLKADDGATVDWVNETARRFKLWKTEKLNTKRTEAAKKVWKEKKLKK